MSVTRPHLASALALLLVPASLVLSAASCADSDPAGAGGSGAGSTGDGGSTGAGTRPTGSTTGTGVTGTTTGTESTGASQCTPEVCDGADNDCNGEIDEGCDCIEGDTQACYTGDPATRTQGLCADGSQTCDATGKWGACEGEVLPADEVCNGEDDDCNGESDDAFEQVTCGVGACQVTTSTCVDGEEVECEPLDPAVTEACDGVDDDCDGTIDNGCACTNNDTQPCYSGPPGTEDEGACQGGTQTCVNGQWGACQGEIVPATESCDAVDQDCDGDVNEGTCSLPNAFSSCASASCTISSCNFGYSHCDNSQTNGCEVRHSGYSNAAPGEYLGVWAADAAYGAGCPAAACEGPIVTKTGTRGRYLWIEAEEDSICSGYVSLAFDLEVPPGVDYDLHVTGSGCASDPESGSSIGGTGADESIVVYCDDTAAVDDSFYVDVEVEHWSGASCQPWTLRVYRRGC